MILGVFIITINVLKYRVHIVKLKSYISKYSMILGVFDVYRLIVLLEFLYNFMKI